MAAQRDGRDARYIVSVTRANPRTGKTLSEAYDGALLRAFMLLRNMPGALVRLPAPAYGWWPRSRAARQCAAAS